MNSNDIELESGLVILSSDDVDCKTIADKIKELSPIAKYEFQKEEELHITDTYMDRIPLSQIEDLPFDSEKLKSYHTAKNHNKSSP